MSKVLRSLSGIATRGLGVLLGAALCSAVACGGDRQVVLVSLTNRPADLSGLGVYYSVDASPGKTVVGGLKEEKGNAPNYDLFGISLDKSLSGTLSVDVYAHQQSLPCIRYRGRADVALTGAPKQEAEIELTQVTTAGCDTSFPKGTMPKNPKIWAKALDDMWIVGDAGRILHWNGAYFEEIPLPNSIADAPEIPRTVNLRAVSGSDSRDVWIVGEKGTALHWDGDRLERINPLHQKGTATFQDSAQKDLQSALEITGVTVDGSGAVRMAAWIPPVPPFITKLYMGFGLRGSKEIHFYDVGGGDVPVMFGPPPVTRPTAIACTTAVLGDCWMVGEGGLILGRRGTSPESGYVNISTTTWTPPSPNFRAVAVEFDSANTSQYDVFGVGDKGAYFQATRQVFQVMGMPITIEATPSSPLWASKIGMTTQLKAVVPLGVTTSLAVLGGAASSSPYYLAKVGTIMMPNEVQTLMEPGLQEPISSMIRVGPQILILSEAGNIITRELP